MVTIDSITATVTGDRIARRFNATATVTLNSSDITNVRANRNLSIHYKLMERDATTKDDFVGSASPVRIDVPSTATNTFTGTFSSDNTSPVISTIKSSTGKNFYVIAMILDSLTNQVVVMRDSAIVRPT